MTPLDAFYHLVHDYPGGAPALALRLGMNKFTLEKKADPDCATHRPAFDEVVKAEKLANDHRPLIAHAEALGYRCVKMGIGENVQLPDLLRDVLRFNKETGEALEAVHRALEDGRITENEIGEFEKQVADIMPASLALVERMRAVAADQAKERATAPRLVGKAP